MSTVATTPMSALTASHSYESKDVGSLELMLAKRKLELVNLQILAHYATLMDVDFPTLNIARNERDWDSFFARLEERFVQANVPCDFKLALTRRLLKGQHLTQFNILSQAAGASYECVRDDLYRIFFPNSDLWNSIMKNIIAADEAETAYAAGTATRTRFGSNNIQQVKAKVAVQRSLLKRVAARYNKQLPEESVMINWALSLMRPTLREAADALSDKSSLDVILKQAFEPPEVRAAADGRAARKNGRGGRRVGGRAEGGAVEA